jgi:Domain of unknown function (DUF1905)
MRFRARIELYGKTATGIVVPPEVVESLKSGKRPPVRVSINGHTYRSTVASMAGEFRLPISAEHRTSSVLYSLSKEPVWHLPGSCASLLRLRWPLAKVNRGIP